MEKERPSMMLPARTTIEANAIPKEVMKTRRSTKDEEGTFAPLNHIRAIFEMPGFSYYAEFVPTRV